MSVPQLWWMSFCDPSKPRGEQFIGVSIVRAAGPEEAIQAAWQQDCNPGGEVMVSGPMTGADPHVRPDEIGRLMGKDEVNLLNARLEAASRALLH